MWKEGLNKYADAFAVSYIFVETGLWSIQFSFSGLLAVVSSCWKDLLCKLEQSRMNLPIKCWNEGLDIE